MHGSTSGIYQVGTITVGPSGVETITPVQSNAPFKNLNVVVKPLEPDANVRYIVSVLFDGEVIDQHTFPLADDRVICIMSYPDKIFPPNVGVATIPQFYGHSRASPNPMVITMQIENLEGNRRTYEIYSTFEEFDNQRSRILDFEEET